MKEAEGLDWSWPKSGWMKSAWEEKKGVQGDVKWEYRFVEMNFDSSSAEQSELLNQLGSAGWEAVAFQPTMVNCVYKLLLKRPINV